MQQRFLPAGRQIGRWMGAGMLAAMLASCAQTPAATSTSTPSAAPTAVALLPTASVRVETPTPPLAEATAAPTEEPSAQPVINAEAFLAMPTLARGYLTSPNELRRIAVLAANGQEPYATAIKAELAFAADTLDDKPIKLPEIININDDIDSPKFISVGAKNVYAWALAYNLLRDHDPEQAALYAQGVRDWIMAMPEAQTQVKDYDHNTRLNLSVYVQNFVYAADLIADWTPNGASQPFAESADAQAFKQWLGEVIVRYPYNAAFTRVNNWGAWARLSTAVIADYVGDAAPLYVQGVQKNPNGAYEIDPALACESGALADCKTVDAQTMYTDAIRLHYEAVDGRMYEFSDSSCDASGAKSMIRPDGGIPDELRRQYDCAATTIPDSYGAAARYSQFAIEAMVSLAEVAWRRGDASLYTHIDADNGRGALYRAVEFLIGNKVTLTRGSMLEMVNRFYTYQLTQANTAAARDEYKQLLAHDLPGILKQEGDWPEGPGFVSFGTLTHGFAEGEAVHPPPAVPAR